MIAIVNIVCVLFAVCKPPARVVRTAVALGTRVVQGRVCRGVNVFQYYEIKK